MTLSPDDLTGLVEDSPAMLWRGDAQGRCVYLNRAQREFWGLGDVLAAEFDWSTTLLEEDQGLVFGPFEIGMREQCAFTCEARYRRADGVIRVLRTRARPHRDGEGRFLGMVGVNEDVTDLRDAEADLTRSNAQLRGGLDQARIVARRLELATGISGIAMSEHDADLRYTWAHNLPEDCLGRRPSDLFGDEIGRPVEAILTKVLATGESAADEVAFAVDGRLQWWEIQACPTTDGQGRRAVLASALDVTTRKLNEQKLEILARELSHRVKNAYSVVQAIVQQSARSAGAPPAFTETVQQRLTTLAFAQDALLASTDDRVSLQALLNQHLAHLERVSLNGEDVCLPARVAPYLALAVHELGTNSLKYGALSTATGNVRLTWHEREPGLLEMKWEENGATPPAAGSSEGFGTALLTRIFSGATGGTAARVWTTDGLTWTATFPLAPLLTSG